MKKRGFEVVSKFKEEVKMPFRGTAKSAGYDIFNNTGDAIIIPPGGISKAISTKLKVYMQPDEFLAMYPRSGHGFKYSVRLANTVGIVDADYHNNKKNEGECFVKFHNQGNEVLVIADGEAMCQTIFQKYLVTDDDEETCGGERQGGFGSTTKKK